MNISRIQHDFSLNIFKLYFKCFILRSHHFLAVVTSTLCATTLFFSINLRVQGRCSSQFFCVHNYNNHNFQCLHNYAFNFLALQNFEYLRVPRSRVLGCSPKMKYTQVTSTCSNSTIKTVEKGVFIVNFEHISHLFQVFLLLTLSKKILAWFF